MCYCCSWNIVGSSPYHCYSGKAISITYSECEYLALGIQHAKRMRYIVLSSVVYCTVICDLSGST